MVQPIGVYLDDPKEFLAYNTQAQAANGVILAVSQLRLLDHLDDGATSAAQIAAKGGLQVDGVSRVLRFLAAQQVLECDDQGRYRHTPRSRLLQDFQTGQQYTREAMGASMGLAQSLKSGKPGFDHSFGKPLFQYLAENPDTVEYFGALMSKTTQVLEAFIFANHQFEPFDLAIDVGGSHGNLMMRLLAEYRGARGIVFDLPETAEQAAAIVAQSPVSDRIEAVGGSFFEAVPADGDLYLLKQILHDWDDESSAAILRSIRAAIPNGGRLAVIEYVLPEENIDHPGFVFDVLMLAQTGGKERRLSEFEALFGKAGFKLDRMTENPHGQSVMEVVPV